MDGGGIDGSWLGCVVGLFVGFCEGKTLGNTLGIVEGSCDGPLVRRKVGNWEGVRLGAPEGREFVYCCEGA